MKKVRLTRSSVAKAAKPHVVTNVKDNSPAALGGVKPGFTLWAVNGRPVSDCLDYGFYVQNKRVTLSVTDRSGAAREITLEKNPNADLGLEFGTFLMDRPKRCKNKCVFCFIDQNPPNMRDSLYFKDDDYRLSFFTGNYITLTNITKRDISRVIYYKLSPVNISVHSTNAKLACFITGNKNARLRLGYIKKLARAGIEMNFQIVLIKGLNDGKELLRTVFELSKFLPRAKSVSVVPAGLTRHRGGLYEIKPFTENDVSRVVRAIEKLQSYFLARRKTRFVFLADEFYARLARFGAAPELTLPPYEAYEGFRQLENGVGMCAKTVRAVKKALARETASGKAGAVSVVTGAAAYPLMLYLARLINAKRPNLEIRVITVKNVFFGESVSVSGLLTGADIMNALKGHDLGSRVLLPRNVLKAGEPVFLDGVTAAYMEKTLRVPLFFCGDGDFIRTVLG